MSYPKDGMGTWFVKLVILGLLNVLGLWAVLKSYNASWWIGVIFLVVVLVAMNITYFRRGGLPFKYLLPGLVFLIAFQLFPAVTTFGASFTNYGTGHLLTQEEAAQSIISQNTRPAEDSESFEIRPVESGGEISMLITDPESGDAFLGTPEGVEKVKDAEFDGDTATGLDGYETLNLGQLASDKALDTQWQELAVPWDVDEGLYISASSPTRGSLVSSDLAYDPANDTFTNLDTDAVYSANGGVGLYTTAEFDEELGQARAQEEQFLTPGWPVFVGLDNYLTVFTDESVRSNFIPILIWSFVFALGTVAMQFVFGLVLALTLQDKRMRGSGFYRIVLVLPYTLPIFMSALLWQGMLNKDFGIINQIIGVDVDWLGEANLARFSVLMVNLWIGYAYMFLVVTGALTSVPADLKEAAYVDGASPMHAFRTVVLPLLMISVSPLLIASFSFNFNNFTLIDLLTGGGPFPGSPIDGGQTDLLITFTYRLGFGTSEQLLGFASAISMLIFLIVAGVSAYSFRLTKKLEDIKQ